MIDLRVFCWRRKGEEEEARNGEEVEEREAVIDDEEERDWRAGEERESGIAAVIAIAVDCALISLSVTSLSGIGQRQAVEDKGR